MNRDETRRRLEADIEGELTAAARRLRLEVGESEDVLAAPGGGRGAADLLDGEGEAREPGPALGAPWALIGGGDDPPGAEEPDFPRRPDRDWTMVAFAVAQLFLGGIAVKLAVDTLRKELKR